MEAKDYETISSIQADVLGYLQDHPNAADSADGIRQWWLMKQLARRSATRVQQALDELVAASLIDCRVMDDGRLVYSRAPKPGNTDSAPEMPSAQSGQPLHAKSRGKTT